MVQQKRSTRKLKWGNVAGIIGSIFVLIGGGYGAGVYKANIDHNLEMIKVNQEFNEKFQTQIDDCRKEQLECLKTLSGNINSVMKELEDNK